MNIVLITGKRSMRNLDTVLKKSEQAVTVGKYTSVRPNTATEIYEKYRPHGILVGDDTVTKGVSLIDFLSIIKMRYGYMRIIFMCSNDSSFNKYASALYSIGVYDIVVGYDPAAIDYAILNPKTETPDIPVTEDSSDENKELSYPDRKVHEYPGNFVGINYKDVSDNSYSMQTVRLTENYERIQRGNVIISVFGYNSRCGSTYTAFDIAFYLHKYERAKVCIVTAVTAGLCKYFNVDETTVNENGFNIDDGIMSRYAFCRSVSDSSTYRVDLPGSDKKYSFSLLGTNKNKLYVFESVIDMLSYASFYAINNGQDAWQQLTMLSLGGKSDVALDEFLKNKPIAEITFCLDNDDAGKHATEQLSDKYALKGYAVSKDIPLNKDFNDDLKAFRALNEKNTVQATKPLKR